MKEELAASFIQLAGSAQCQVEMAAFYYFSPSKKTPVSPKPFCGISLKEQASGGKSFETVTF